jgi:hypothetical protein
MAINIAEIISWFLKVIKKWSFFLTAKYFCFIVILCKVYNQVFQGRILKNWKLVWLYCAKLALFTWKFPYIVAWTSQISQTLVYNNKMCIGWYGVEIFKHFLCSNMFNIDIFSFQDVKLVAKNTLSLVIWAEKGSDAAIPTIYLLRIHDNKLHIICYLYKSMTIPHSQSQKQKVVIFANFNFCFKHQTSPCAIDTHAHSRKNNNNHFIGHGWQKLHTFLSVACVWKWHHRASGRRLTLDMSQTAKWHVCSNSQTKHYAKQWIFH